MRKKILILTEAGDLHAYAIAEALRRKGSEPVLWHTSDFPSQSSESVLFEGCEERLQVDAPGLALREADFNTFSTVWRRRPSQVLPLHLLHPADHKFVESECNIFRRALFGLVSCNSFWVNPLAAATAAGSKLTQHRCARNCGLTLPDTLYSNDPGEIRRFLVRHGGEIVYKTFRGVSWRDAETYWAPYTSLLTEEKLVADELLAATPGIYQALVPKDYELRVTVMGRKVFAAKIFSQVTSAGRLDWRKAYNELRMVPCSLPAAIEEQSLALIESSGLVFGCLDFIVSPSGEHYFLEVNEMGQFLFVESFTGLPLLDAFTEFLAQGTVDFAWEETPSSLRYSDVQEAAERTVAEMVQTHVNPPEHAVWDGKDLPPA
ncbi:MAG: hypothetical protein ABI163_14795 [Thermoanaerobaculia bacterium]